MTDLHLLHRDNALSAEALARLYEKLTGKRPTEAEMAAAREQLAAKQDQSQGDHGNG